ncbi:MAG: TRAP transporter permease DctQ [Ponticaulis sp.]|nr:TRAP transporter permease DctQ [Ponticaulis sp.]|tara:strand:- start:18291 stop:18956 length:666 start_codon:yes stop_codon:yes gene_type:complete
MDLQDIFLLFGRYLNWLGLGLSVLLLLPLVTLILPDLVHKPSRGLSEFIDRLTGIALEISIFAAMFLVLIQLTAVLASYAMGLSFTWLSELVIYGFATLFMFGSAVALRNSAHVRVDIFRPRFGETGRNWIELTGIYLFLFPIMIRILQTGEQGLTRAWTIFEGSRETDGLPILFLFKTLLPIFAILMIVQGLSEALKAALRLTGHLEPQTPQSEGAGHGA